MINDDGRPFDRELSAATAVLAALPNAERIEYRNRNASDIAKHDAECVLVVAGPSAGKSHLFFARIIHWLRRHPDAEIYVSSFVRKLVEDLRAELDGRIDLTDVDKRRVTVTTLHTLARSLLERNGGTAAQPLAKHIKVIAPPWDAVVWRDVLQFHDGATGPSREQFGRQLNTESYDNTNQWNALRATYALLSRFYNAVGFADMIVLAREAVEQNPTLIEHLLWIVDEYQDFNKAEDHLLLAITANVLGVLIAGDDEQALYVQLKSSHPDIIVGYYDSVVAR